MPDLNSLLAAEAERQQPADQPALAGLVRRRRLRDWRNRVLGGAVAVLVLGMGLGGLAVFRGSGQSAPADPPTATVPSATAAAGAPVSGTLQLTGGPRGASPSGVAGTVFFEGTDGASAATVVSADGRFAITIKPGRYTVTGRSPAFGAEQYLCHAPAPAIVPPGGLRDVRVLCVRR
jgi:hypothetical protein